MQHVSSTSPWDHATQTLQALSQAGIFWESWSKTSLLQTENCCKGVRYSLGVAPGMCAHTCAGESQHRSWKQLCYLQHAPLVARISTLVKLRLTQFGQAPCWCSFPRCWYLRIHQLGYPPAARHGRGHMYLPCRRWCKGFMVFLDGFELISLAY